MNTFLCLTKFQIHLTPNFLHYPVHTITNENRTTINSAQIGYALSSGAIFFIKHIAKTATIDIPEINAIFCIFLPTSFPSDLFICSSYVQYNTLYLLCQYLFVRLAYFFIYICFTLCYSGFRKKADYGKYK